MNYTELEALHKQTSEHTRAIMRDKNHDYTDGSTDPFANFRAAELLDIDPVNGILLRMLDKVMRLKTFTNKGALHVAGESALDACDDIVNYAILIKGLITERAEPPNQQLRGSTMSSVTGRDDTET